MPVADKRSPAPVELRRLSDPLSPGGSADAPGIGLRISWSDGQVMEIDSATLRKNCPCATCLEARGEGSHAKPLSGSKTGGRSLLKVVSATIEQETDLRELWPVGNYAVGMRWADKHDSGIYPYALLRALGEASRRQNSDE